MISLGKWKASSYINCLRDFFSYDRVTIDSMAFLIASANDDELDVFKPDTNGIMYAEKLEDIKGNCEKWIKIFSSYKDDIIKNTSMKLWKFYSNKNVVFNEDEKRLLTDLGIKI
ncbi:hypothetical protein [Acidianus brierleyi]|uniref:Uncharacterized protein n=1 Tax=Acidianus brierleyi TaxID=41673 RepID=A0A2U9IHA7_9CREN|nr:hypothetical protein [Acidianus brierleyi]AWR95390.1 hypothetical protein DFR85_13075 [Acidianus brierleyi]